MTGGKNINLFLMDGSMEGRVKCGLANWTGLAYKIPRDYFNQCENIKETKNNGIYFMVGVDEETDQPAVYVGQARQRSNGKGLLGRIVEPHNSITYWKEAVLLTTRDDYFGPTELCYLENRFFKIASEAKRYLVTNGNTPSIGNPTEEKRCELDEFIELAKLVISAMGYKFLVPIVPETLKLKFENKTEHKVEAYHSSNVLLSMSYNGIEAKGLLTEEGVVLLKGSGISQHETASCPKLVRKLREQNAEKIANGILQEDILLSSPSSAAAFVAGTSVSGNSYWKDEQGISLGELLK